MSSYRYLSTAEAATLIRKALKDAFPLAKFSVRSSRGGSVDIYWTDGPTRARVEAVAGNFAGGGFDAMIDLGYSIYHWVQPDGTVSMAYTDGTAGSGGIVQARSFPMPEGGAELVHFASRSVGTHRAYSASMLERAIRETRIHWGLDADEMPVVAHHDFDGGAYLKGGTGFPRNDPGSPSHVVDLVHVAIRSQNGPLNGKPKASRGPREE